MEHASFQLNGASKRLFLPGLRRRKIEHRLGSIGKARVDGDVPRVIMPGGDPVGSGRGLEGREGLHGFALAIDGHGFACADEQFQHAGAIHRCV